MLYTTITKNVSQKYDKNIDVIWGVYNSQKPD